MDIFKLFFEHDLRLDQTVDRDDKGSSTLEEFMKPVPTFSKFYLTGTRLDTEQFGLQILRNYDHILDALDDTFEDQGYYTASGLKQDLRSALRQSDIGDPILIGEEPLSDYPYPSLAVDSGSNVGHIKDKIRTVLEKDFFVLYKEPSPDGFDLHLFSRKNIYDRLFYAIKPLLGDHFRFFSINGKRVRSERQFYFETYTLERPPHGAEEVFPETVL